MPVRSTNPISHQVADERHRDPDQIRRDSCGGVGTGTALISRSRARSSAASGCPAGPVPQNREYGRLHSPENLGLLYLVFGDAEQARRVQIA